jgi:DNA-binding LacI/PurR family transcriptional regulator
MGVTSSPIVGGRVSSQIFETLRLDILSRKIVGGAFLPSVRKLAAEHGAAKKTIERALKRLEAEGLVASVPRHGFRVVPRSGGSDRGLPVAYLAHAPGSPQEFWDEFHTQLLVSFQRVAASKGWSLLVVSCGEGGTEEMLEQLAAASVCGAVVDSFEKEVHEALAGAGIPFVAVDGWLQGPEVNMVNQDGFLGGVLAATHLLSKGHQRIGFFGAETFGNDLQVVARYSGVAGALDRAGLHLDPGLCVRAPLNDREVATARARELLSRPDRPTGILSLWQDMTAGLVAAARELGLKPGEDFDMVGWSTEESYGSYVAQFYGGPVPPAVVWSVARMAEEAVRCLKNRRADPTAPPVHVRVPVTLREVGPQAHGGRTQT